MDPNNAPTRKVTVGLVANAIASIGCWIYAEATGKVIPGEIALSFMTIAQFLIQYAVKDKEV